MEPASLLWLQLWISKASLLALLPHPTSSLVCTHFPSHLAEQDSGTWPLVQPHESKDTGIPCRAGLLSLSKDAELFGLSGWVPVPVRVLQRSREGETEIGECLRSCLCSCRAGNWEVCRAGRTSGRSYAADWGRIPSPWGNPTVYGLHLLEATP